MRTQSRKSLLLFCTTVLLGLTLVGLAFAQTLSAAGALARPQAAPAQETSTGATGTITATTEAATDHAAHYPASSQIVTGTAALSGTAPISGSMMMDMMGMMDAMHSSMAADLGKSMDKYAQSMTPEMAAEMGRMEGTAHMMWMMGMLPGGMMKWPMMGGIM